MNVGASLPGRPASVADLAMTSPIVSKVVRMAVRQLESAGPPLFCLFVSSYFIRATSLNQILFLCK